MIELDIYINNISIYSWNCATCSIILIFKLCMEKSIGKPPTQSLQWESVLKADRGSIKDSSGTMLASVDAQYSIVLYKTKVNNETLNTTILKLLNILSTNSDSYVDNFLIDVNPYRFKLEEEESQKKWKKQII